MSTSDICRYSYVRMCDELGVNQRLKTLFAEVCSLRKTTNNFIFMTFPQMLSYSGNAEYIATSDGDFYFSNSSLLNDGGIIFPKVGGGHWVRKYTGDINVKWYGARGNGITDDTTPFLKAKTTAGTLKKRVYVPSGTYILSSTLSFSGGSSLVGDGLNSILKFKNQTGSCIDISSTDGNFEFARVFEKFKIIGDGVQDPTKTHIGIYLHNVVTCTAFKDISITNTGGAGLKLDTESDLNSFENISIQQPVGAGINDIPYLELKGIVNGNTFRNIMLRSISSASEGVSGCVVIRGAEDNSYFPNNNTFYSLATEYHHIPENGCIVSICGSENSFYSFSEFDSSTTIPTTFNTCKFRFKEYPNSGSNILSGLIPGAYNSLNHINYGVIIEGSGNRIEGAPAGASNHILIANGASKNYISLAGSRYNPLDIKDNSGNNTNVVVDCTKGIWTLGGKKSTDVLIKAFLVNGDTTSGVWSGESIHFGYSAEGLDCSSRIVGYQRPQNVVGSRLKLQSHSNMSGVWNEGLMLNEFGNIGIGLDLPTEKLDITGNLKLNTAGNKLKIAKGSNASVGVATLVGGTVTINTTAVLTGSDIFCSVRTPSGTQGFLSTPESSIINGVSFTINSTSITETSTVNWWIIN